MRSLILLWLVAVCSCSAWAFRPPVDSRDGVTLAFEGFDEKTDTPALCVAERRAAKPFAVRVRAANKGAKPVAGAFRVWVNDDWELAGPPPPAELALAANETRELSFAVQAKPDRALNALYPIHASWALPGGEPLHPIAIFRAKDAPSRASAARAPCVPKKGRVRLDKFPATVWTEVNGRVEPLAGGASFEPAQVAAEGGVRPGFTCHPPWQGGAGAVWRDIPLALPETRPCALRFATALLGQSGGGAPSDGTEHKVFVIEGEKATEVFSRFSAARTWQDGTIDLAPWAGMSVTLRLWVGPGPKMDTTCDRCGWADPVLEIGEMPSAPTEADWAKCEASARKAARAACAHGTDLPKLRFSLKGREGVFGAAWSLGSQGLFDGVLAFTDGRRELTYRGFACEVDGDAVGGALAGRTCARVETKATDAEAIVTHWLAPRDEGGETVPLRARIWAERGALKMAWDMPGVTRNAQGEPRYTSLSLGTGSLPAERAYAGFGNVIEQPRDFSLGASGFDLSTRHVGADYENGLSLVQATDVFPDALVCGRARKQYALVTRHDATFTFVPSAKGAFAAARHFRDMSGYRPGSGVETLLGRMCLDQWWGIDYDHVAADVARAAKYGVRDAVFVKHDWQRWGYDYRLPDICPPRGDAAAFRRLGEACARAGWLFVPHDNYIDYYPDADGFSYDRIVFNPDGTPYEAWYNDGERAQSYRTLPHGFRPWLDRNAALLRQAAAPDGVFIDVFAAIAPFDYYDRTGTFFPKTCTSRAWGAAFDAYRAGLGRPQGVTISEAGTDALVGHLDAGQSDHFPAHRWMPETAFADAERVPWHDMATHGRFVLLAGGLGDKRYSAPDWTRWGDTARHGYASDDYLCTTVIGGRSPMCDGPFSRRTVMTYWLLHDVCAALARSEFESLTFGGNIHRQHTTFAGGGEVWINRETNAVWKVAGDVALPMYGFLAKAAGVEAGVTLRNGRRCAYAKADGLTFADARPDGKSAELIDFGGIWTDGAFRLERRDAAAWILTPLPDSRPFRARIDLDAFGAGGRRVERVEAIEPEKGAKPVAWRQEGGQVGLSADGKAFAYRIAFASEADGSAAVGVRTAALDGDAWADSIWLSVQDAPVEDGIIGDATPAAPGTSWFVCSHTNADPVVSARWMTAGLGVYELYLNGRRVGADFLKPGFTDWRKTKYAFTYDVTDAFRCAKGEANVLAAEVSAGWWRDKVVTPTGHKGFVGRKSAFRGVLELRFADGSTRRFGTNTNDWRAGIAGPVTQASIFDGEHFDARRQPGFAVWRGLGVPEANDEFRGEILPTDGAEVALRRDLTLKPVCAYVWRGVDGVSAEAFGKVKVVREFPNREGPFDIRPGETLVIDFGQNAASVPSFRFSAAEGTVLTARPAEMLNDGGGLKSRGNDGPEGSVYRANLRAGFETGRLLTYTFAGEGVEAYCPRFTYFGYRYLSVTATEPVKIQRVVSVPVSSIARDGELGSLVTGDKVVNRLISHIRWGMFSNYLSVPTDCPQRNERLGWAADTQIFCEAASFNADVYGFLRKWMRDLRDGQDARGSFPAVAPHAQYGESLMRIGWADAGVIVPYQMFRQFGDRRIVDENWAAMEKFVAHVSETRYAFWNGIVNECGWYQWGDWLSLTKLESCPYKSEYSAFETDANGRRQIKPDAVCYWNYLGGCHWLQDAQMMAEMAEGTGREAAAAKYRAMAATAEDYLKRTFFTADGGTILPVFRDMQTPMLFALKLGLVEGDAKARAIADLRASITASGGTLHTGFLGTAIALDTLTASGLSSLAYDLLLNRKFPGWLYSVDQGATTVWERWNSYTKKDGFGPVGMNSFNHYAYGSVLAWLYKTAAGIAADVRSPGFRHIVMAPVPDRRLGFVKAEYRSSAGLVKSAWRYKGDEWIWEFTVPAGATATVTVPGEKPRLYGAGSWRIVGQCRLRTATRRNLALTRITND